MHEGETTMTVTPIEVTAMHEIARRIGSLVDLLVAAIQEAALGYPIALFSLLVISTSVCIVAAFGISV